MSIIMKVGFGCHLLAMVAIGITGLIYLFRSQFMPYHAIAVGKTWSEIDPAFQTLLLALIRAYGGAMTATALAMGILLFIPFRQGVLWVRWVVPSIGLIATIPTVYSGLSVALNTPAKPPWKGVLLVMVLLVAGFILSLVS
jgi:hypothetical protein